MLVILSLVILAFLFVGYALWHAIAANMPTDSVGYRTRTGGRYMGSDRS